MLKGRIVRFSTGFGAAFAAVFGLTAGSTVVEAQERQSLRWSTCQVGCYGNRIAAATTALLEKALDDEYTVTVHPYSSTTAAAKGTMDGEADLGYTADIGMRQLYDGERPYEDYDPAAGMLVHTWYAYPMESLMAVPAHLADDIQCWSDLSGKPVFYTTAGFMNWHNWRRVYDILGYEFNHVEIDVNTNADAMEAGTIVGSGTYTTAGRTLAGYWIETELRTEFKIVNPCPDEREKVEAAGFSFVEVDTSVPYSIDVGVDKAYGVPILFGYNVRADISEDLVYKMLSGLYELRDELVEVDAGYTPLANDFVGLQVAGINANPDVPVHPGLARFLEDHDAWNDDWTIAESGS